MHDGRSRARHVERRWTAGETTATALAEPRRDVVLERRGEDGSFVQAAGPFVGYRRTVRVDGDAIVERTDYRLSLPWFGWLFFVPLRRALARRGGASPGTTGRAGAGRFWKAV